MCYSEKTLRRKAKNIGNRIEKGCLRMTIGNAVFNPLQIGYSVYNEDGYMVWGSYDNLFIHLWDLQDVEDYLRERYSELGLQF